MSNNPPAAVAKMASREQAQALSYHPRTAPTQTTNQIRQESPGFLIKPGLDKRGHSSLYYRLKIVIHRA